MSNPRNIRTFWAAARSASSRTHFRMYSLRVIPSARFLALISWSYSVVPLNERIFVFIGAVTIINNLPYRQLFSCGDVINRY
jgi:hypothetical protein